jgi:kynurenine--oxoglutarate transaminase/cysteine-S-conjugate beta-lyase/glutamine--phenylpyruvate transaminase
MQMSLRGLFYFRPFLKTSIAFDFGCRFGSRSALRSMSSKITPTERLQGIDRNVWVEFTAIGSKCKVNLGQGFPNYSPPQFLVEALQEAAAKPMLHQYTRGHGHPRLVNALAKLHSILQERSIDPMNEVVVGTGAYSALFFTFQAFVHPGDEVCAGCNNKDVM